MTGAGLTPSSVAPVPDKASRKRFWGLALGSVGVVYGDIGTSPLYAFREAMNQAREPARRIWTE